jgi:hypothetical protein
MTNLVEHERRKVGALGSPVLLADGHEWLLATPVYEACFEGLTCPRIETSLNRLFESLVLHGNVSLTDLWDTAVPLLRMNYELSDDELAGLLSIAPGIESRLLVNSILEALFGSEYQTKSYCDWVRASLLANGLSGIRIPNEALPNVLAILVATNRTVPLSRFSDACRDVRERSTLEYLV